MNSDLTDTGLSSARWENIDCVLLDLDGTLLDLHFDNHFWLEHVPSHYAQRQHIDLDEAKRRLYDRFNALRGTLRWYCLDHWAQELQLDILQLKREVEHLIDIRPNVEQFLDAVRESGRRVVLATNAHPGSLILKMEKTRLAGHFDAVYSAHDFGFAKEQAAYWQQLFAREQAAPQRCLLVDDNLSVLRSALDYGIGQVLGVRRPDSRAAEIESSDFPLLADFAHLLPIRPL